MRPDAAPSYSPREERASILIHRVGAAAMVPGIVWLWLRAPYPASSLVFGVAALAMFATSVLYHSASDPSLRARRRVLDHAAIYVLIAGTYTPFALDVLPAHWGWPMFGLVWAAALTGVTLRVRGRRGSRRVAVALYLVMGWGVVIAIRPLAQALGTTPLAWLMAGGLAYTLGVPFYVAKNRAYTHAAWHAFVLLGVACHFMAILLLRD